MGHLCFFLSQEDMQLQKKNKTLLFLSVECVKLEDNSLIDQVFLKSTDIDIQFCSCS